MALASAAAAAAAAAVAVAAAVVVVSVMVAGVAAWPPTGAGAAGTTPAPVVPLDSLIVAQPLTGFVAAPTGPTDGPLTATEFASQSADPDQAVQQFDALAARPGFGASIRLWTDRTGTGTGANDLVVLLFRISDPAEAAAFEHGLYQPFDSTVGSTRFTLPSVPGARGTTMTVTTPVAATEQVVVFRAGRYVAMIQLASSSASTNTDPLTAAQATTVSYEELTTLRTGDPGGASASAPAAATRPHRTAPPAAAAPSGTSVATTGIVVGAVVLVLLATGVALAWRRRRRAGRSPDQADPWGPGGLFEPFGPEFGDRPDTADGLGTPDTGGTADSADTGGGGAAGAPRAVPELDPSAREVPVG